MLGKPIVYATKIHTYKKRKSTRKRRSYSLAFPLIITTLSDQNAAWNDAKLKIFLHMHFDKMITDNNVLKKFLSFQRKEGGDRRFVLPLQQLFTWFISFTCFVVFFFFFEKRLRNKNLIKSLVMVVRFHVWNIKNLLVSEDAVSIKHSLHLQNQQWRFSNFPGMLFIGDI